jgi:hypothetical protein
VCLLRLREAAAAGDREGEDGWKYSRCVEWRVLRASSEAVEIFEWRNCDPLLDSSSLSSSAFGGDGSEEDDLAAASVVCFERLIGRSGEWSTGGGETEGGSGGVCDEGRGAVAEAAGGEGETLGGSSWGLDVRLNDLIICSSSLRRWESEVSILSSWVRRLWWDADDEEEEEIVSAGVEEEKSVGRNGEALWWWEAVEGYFGGRIRSGVE